MRSQAQSLQHLSSRRLPLENDTMSLECPFKGNPFGLPVGLESLGDIAGKNNESKQRIR